MEANSTNCAVVAQSPFDRGDRMSICYITHVCMRQNCPLQFVHQHAPKSGAAPPPPPQSCIPWTITATERRRLERGESPFEGGSREMIISADAMLQTHEYLRNACCSADIQASFCIKYIHLSHKLLVQGSTSSGLWSVMPSNFLPEN